mgnify:CR=1 FL=1
MRRFGSALAEASITDADPLNPAAPLDPARAESPAQSPPAPGLTERWSLKLTILAVLAVLTAMRMAQEVSIPIVVAILIAYALQPVVAVVGKAGLGRAGASAVVLVAILSAVGGTADSLRNQALTVLEELPAGARSVVLNKCAELFGIGNRAY